MKSPPLSFFRHDTVKVGHRKALLTRKKRERREWTFYRCSGCCEEKKKQTSSYIIVTITVAWPSNQSYRHYQWQARTPVASASSSASASFFPSYRRPKSRCQKWGGAKGPTSARRLPLRDIVFPSLSTKIPACRTSLSSIGSAESRSFCYRCTCMQYNLA